MKEQVLRVSHTQRYSYDKEKNGFTVKFASHRSQVPFERELSVGWWGSLTAGVRRLAEEEEMGCRWNNPGCCWREDMEVSN